MKHTRSEKDARDAGVDDGGTEIATRAREKEDKQCANAVGGGTQPASGKRGLLAAALKQRRSLGANRLALRKNETSEGTWSVLMSALAVGVAWL